MAWFGPKSWGAPVCQDEERVPFPEHLKCEWCGEGFSASDEGMVNSAGQAFHLECQLRLVAGSASHQLKMCVCYGGTWEDPPELTRREAARLAANMFHQTCQAQR